MGETDKDQRFLAEDIVQVQVPIGEGEGETDDEGRQGEDEEADEVRTDEGQPDQ